MATVEDWEKHQAILALLDELPALLSPDEDGYVPGTDLHIDQMRQGLTIAAEAIASRNE